MRKWLVGLSLAFLSCAPMVRARAGCDEMDLSATAVAVCDGRQPMRGRLTIDGSDPKRSDSELLLQLDFEVVPLSPGRGEARVTSVRARRNRTNELRPFAGRVTIGRIEAALRQPGGELCGTLSGSAGVEFDLPLQVLAEQRGVAVEPTMLTLSNLPLRAVTELGSSL